MELILLQKIHKLGGIGDVVSVKPGFARNHLLPSGKALRATKENIETFEKDKAELLKKNNLEIKKATEIKEKITVLKLSIVRSASDTGVLYGSVTTRDIAKLINEEGISINRKEIVLDKPIKDLGSYEVKAVLHAEVEATLQLKVVRSLDENPDDLVKSKKTDNVEEILNIDDELFEEGAKPSQTFETTDSENEDEDIEKNDSVEPSVEETAKIDQKT